jgi:hypothetical protein
MKSIIVMALAGAALTLVARYFKITSFEQVKEWVPELKKVVPNIKQMMAHN